MPWPVDSAVWLEFGNDILQSPDNEQVEAIMLEFAHCMAAQQPLQQVRSLGSLALFPLYTWNGGWFPFSAQSTPLQFPM